LALVARRYFAVVIHVEDEAKYGSIASVSDGFIERTLSTLGQEARTAVILSVRNSIFLSMAELSFTGG